MLEPIQSTDPSLPLACPMFGTALMTALAIGASSTLAGCASDDGMRAKVLMTDGAAAARADWHAQRIAALTAENGWLTLVGLDFLPEGDSTIGSSPEATFPYANCESPVVGSIRVEGEIVRFTPHGGESIEWIADDRGTPSVVRSGPVSFTFVRRNGRLALRVRDNLSPVRTGFCGIQLFPYDGRFAVEATVVRPMASEAIPITNVTGFVENQPVAARLRFALDGAVHELVATAGSNGRLFVVFGDSTNGNSSYGGGRFLDIDAPVDGLVRIDFNRATNPPCSFTAFATCPLPPRSNRLPIAIPAGERRPESQAPSAH